MPPAAGFSERPRACLLRPRFLPVSLPATPRRHVLFLGRTPPRLRLLLRSQRPRTRPRTRPRCQQRRPHAPHSTAKRHACNGRMLADASTFYCRTLRVWLLDRSSPPVPLFSPAESPARACHHPLALLTAPSCHTKHAFRCCSLCPAVPLLALDLLISLRYPSPWILRVCFEPTHAISCLVFTFPMLLHPAHHPPCPSPSAEPSLPAIQASVSSHTRPDVTARFVRMTCSIYESSSLNLSAMRPSTSCGSQSSSCLPTLHAAQHTTIPRPLAVPASSRTGRSRF